MTCSSHGDKRRKMSMDRRMRQKGRKKGVERGDGGGLIRGIGRLWKAVESNDAGHKPLSQTITIHAINLSLSPVTRIMRTARVSASITFEIPRGLDLAPSDRFFTDLTHVIFLLSILFLATYDRYSSR